MSRHCVEHLWVDKVAPSSLITNQGYLIEMDKLRGMEVMIAVAEAGSFAAAASKLDMSAVMVGKYVQQLEAHLHARLVQRSTRRQSLTEVGVTYYEHSKRIIEQVRWAESAVELNRAIPQGLLRVSAPFTLGSHVIAPLIADYLQQHVQVRVDLQLTDSIVDLAGENIDAAIRIGEVKDENLVARPLRAYRMVIAAAPRYLEVRGTPMQLSDLSNHDCLSHSVWQRRTEWTMREGSETQLWPELTRFACSHGDGLRTAALQGLGVIMQPEVLLADDLSSGRLLQILPHCIPPARPVYLVYATDRRQLPKLSRFVEHVVAALGIHHDAR